MSFRTFLTELAHITDLADKKGSSFISDLLEKEVVINIKIDQSSLVVMFDGDKLRFFGRGGKKEIDEIHLVGSDVYKQAIEHIKKKDFRHLPKNVKFYLENFNDRLQTQMKYSKKPKNDLIISFAEHDGVIIKPNDSRIHAASELLDVDPPPIIFDGKLDDDRRRALKNWLKKPLAGSFGEFIGMLFDIPSKYDYLMGPNFEGIVLYFSDASTPTAKIIDPKFTEKVKAKKNDDDPFNDLIMNGIIESLQKDVEFSGDTYVNKIASITQNIIPNFDSDKLMEFEDEVSRKRFSGIDREKIPQSLKSLIGKKFWVEDVFRNLLFMLREPKTRATKYMSKKQMVSINNLIKRLQETDDETI